MDWLAQDGWITVESSLPHVITDDHNIIVVVISGISIRCVFIWQKRATVNRLDAQDIKKIECHIGFLQSFGLPDSRQCHAIGLISCQLFKGATAISIISKKAVSKIDFLRPTRWVDLPKRH